MNKPQTRLTIAAIGYHDTTATPPTMTTVSIPALWTKDYAYTDIDNGFK
jgi:hypothetical protein